MPTVIITRYTIYKQIVRNLLITVGSPKAKVEDEINNITEITQQLLCQ